MATIGGRYPTLFDAARMSDPKGEIMPVVEILEENNAMIEDAPFFACNNGRVNITTTRTGIPEGTWRELYKGVAQEKTETQQVVDTCGLLASYCDVDQKEAELQRSGRAAYLTAINEGFIQGLGNTIQYTALYGNEKTSPAKFTGLAPRYGKISTDSKKIGYNVIDGGGAGADNTSMWVVEWGKRSLHFIYPEGSKAGLQKEERGVIDVSDADGKPYPVYRTYYSWDIGLSVVDWRYCVRIANIDVSDLASAGESSYSGANVLNLLIKAFGRFPSMRMGTRVIYANETVITALNLLIANHKTAALKIEEIGGKPTTTFWGNPIKKVDSIGVDEARIV